ncbi:MAG: hypothetical protein AAF195_01865, partial [Pseudomonadota bacterium]
KFLKPRHLEELFTKVLSIKQQKQLLNTFLLHPKFMIDISQEAIDYIQDVTSRDDVKTDHLSDIFSALESKVVKRLAFCHLGDEVNEQICAYYLNNSDSLNALSSKSQAKILAEYYGNNQPNLNKNIILLAIRNQYSPEQISAILSSLPYEDIKPAYHKLLQDQFTYKDMPELRLLFHRLPKERLEHIQNILRKAYDDKVPHITFDSQTEKDLASMIFLKIDWKGTQVMMSPGTKVEDFIYAVPGCYTGCDCGKKPPRMIIVNTTQQDQYPTLSQIGDSTNLVSFSGEGGSVKYYDAMEMMHMLMHVSKIEHDSSILHTEEGYEKLGLNKPIPGMPPPVKGKRPLAALTDITNNTELPDSKRPALGNKKSSMGKAAIGHHTTALAARRAAAGLSREHVRQL